MQPKLLVSTSTAVAFFCSDLAQNARDIYSIYGYPSHLFQDIRGTASVVSFDRFHIAPVIISIDNVYMTLNLTLMPANFLQQ